MLSFEGGEMGDYLVIGPYAFKGERLTFSTTDAAMAIRFWSARENDSDVTVMLTQPAGLKEVTGKVRSVELVPGGERPIAWQVVMLAAVPYRLIVP